MRRFLLSAFLSVVFVAVIVASTSFLIEGRFRQLDEAMELASFSMRATPTFNIAARLQLLRDRLDGDRDSLEQFELEARLQSLASGITLYSSIEPGATVPAEDGGYQLSDLYEKIGRLMGRGSADRRADQPFLPLLDEAYFWERNRHYSQAIRRYAELENEPALSDGIRETVGLHAAFCQTMTGKYDLAIEGCRHLLKTSTDPEVRDSSRRILRFVREINERQRELAEVESDGLDLGRQSFFNVDYSGAIVALEKFLEEQVDHPGQNEARYYKGRSHEELGQNGEAIREYLRLLILDEGGLWARDAERRLVMMDAFYDLAAADKDKIASAPARTPDRELSEIVEKLLPLFQKASAGTVAKLEGATREIEAALGELFVQTEPTGAIIVVNGQEIGPSPLFIPGIPVGRVILVARFDGATVVRELIVEDGKLLSVNLKFTPTTGTVRIVNNWIEKEVYLDDRVIYPRDDVVSDLAPGRYGLTLIGVSTEGKPVYWEGFVVVTAGEQTVVTIP